MHRTSLARRLGSVAVVASLALGAAACSGDDSSSADDSSSTSDESSADESIDAESEDATEDATGEATEDAAEEAAGDAPAELSADEFFPTVMAALQDAESFRFTSTTTAAGSTQEVSGEGRFTDGKPEVKASTTGAAAVDMIMLDQVVYLKSEAMGTGDKWMKIDLREAGDSLFGMLAKASDPSAMMGAMSSPKKFELIGAEDVDGVATNRYRITIDSKKYATAMGLPAEMGSFLPDEIVQDMWVDAEDRPVKYSATIETPMPDGGKPTTSTTEGQYHDFGVDVEIEAPPASEITDAPALPGAA